MFSLCKLEKKSIRNSPDKIDNKKIILCTFKLSLWIKYVLAISVEFYFKVKSLK